ncbi:DUF1211 domain-containing protein [Oleiharenicola lentus]|jgi:uncharacterized membrane protein|uniref:DUF1211 domain-containing protein n=1 Tax=Oleiharenicola lentus TaxID=2508720 RepID=A0A4Q1CC65_9BACT|nr:TMEM175 family protein [Oleiharenicola lentus]RXK56610.1 DUF1211 domain-containing protein [Oleiharenicola lentus]
MARNRPQPTWRDRLPGRRPEDHFQWRGKEVSRLENLADAVFGFSLTLLVVSTEVPRDFAGLQQVLRGFPAFAACFAILLLFWNEHYKFFRRYGLEDFYTRTLNYFILLLVLFSVYPLKFLFGAWLGGGTRMNGPEELWFIYRIYGLGFASIWTLYALLQGHALRRREQLRLNELELIYTRLQLTEFRLQVAVCFLSVGLTYVTTKPWLPGVCYALIGPLAAWNGMRHGRQVQAVLDRRNQPSLS